MAPILLGSATSQPSVSDPDARSLGRLVDWLVMQPQKLIGPEGARGVGPATVVAELDFENFRTENLHKVPISPRTKRRVEGSVLFTVAATPSFQRHESRP